VPILDAPPEPLFFYREFVAKNRPCLIRNAISHFPALHKWNHQYLRDVLGQTNVSINVTPNGRADAVVNESFVLPERRTLAYTQFLDLLERQRSVPPSALPPFSPHACRSVPSECQTCQMAFGDEQSSSSHTTGVVYLSEQNSSFRTEFSQLWGDVDLELAWASEVRHSVFLCPTR
jgi:jumonji domain-containing protein 7